jgi:hypothetical protein
MRGHKLLKLLKSYLRRMLCLENLLLQDLVIVLSKIMIKIKIVIRTTKIWIIVLLELVRIPSLKLLELLLFHPMTHSSQCMLC